MTNGHLLKFAEEDESDAAEIALELGQELNLQSLSETVLDPAFLEETATEIEMETDLAFELLVSPSTPPAAIFGTGLWVNDDETISPAVFVHEMLAPHRGADIEQTQAATLVGRLLSPTLRRRDSVLGRPGIRIKAVGLPTPSEQSIGPGVGVSCSAGDSTLGAKISDGGSDGITTAGHAARQTGQPVTWRGDVIGRVTWSDYVENHRSGEICADIAIIHLEGGVDDSAGPDITETVTAVKFDNVVMHGRDGQANAWIRGASESWAFNKSSGFWGNVYITDECISSNGDSGAPVLKQRGEGLVGHVVAGVAPGYTLIQDAEYQFGMAEVSLR